MASDMARHIGARIAKRRKEKDWTQRQLIEAMGINPPLDKQRISDWERGIHKPSEHYMELLTAALGIEESWLYEKEAEETPDVIGTLDAVSDAERLAAIESKLDALLDAFGLRSPGGAIVPDPPARLDQRLRDALPTDRDQQQHKTAPGQKRRRKNE